MTTETKDLPPLPSPDGYAAIVNGGSVIVPPRDFAKHNAYAVFTADQMREYALEAIRASATSAPEHGWSPIETAPNGRKVLAGYLNELGNWRTVTACYYLPKTLEIEDDGYSLDDDGYAPEGWYEESETQDSILATDMPPTHWQPLPPPPGTTPQPPEAT